MPYRHLLLLLVVPIASVCLFGEGAQLQITNASLPHGQQGNIYSEVFNATAGASPYRWKISAGTTPLGVAMNENGNFVGTPERAGTFDFTVTVTDAGTNTASRNFSVTVAPATGYDGPARLPMTTVASSMADTPAPGLVISVDAGGDVQAALDSTHCGDTIELQAGATFTGNFRFPALSCDQNHWVIVRTT